MADFPSIPDPQANSDSLFETVRTLKIAVEMLAGHRAGGAATIKYVGVVLPTNPQVSDIWVTPDGKTLYWNGGDWVDISSARFAELETARTELTAATQQLDADVAALQTELDQTQASTQTAITDLNTSVAAAQQEAEDARAQADTARAEIVTVNNTLTAAVNAAQADVDQAFTEINSVQQDLAASTASLTASVQAAQADADQALTDLAAVSTTIVSIQSDVASNSAAITTEAGARATADTALAGQITSLTSTVNNNTAAITQEAVTRANADTALSAQITSLTSTVNGNTAAIQSEATTRASADTSLSADITSLTSTVNTNNSTVTAAISNEAATRASADTALSSQITSLTATVNSNNSTLTASITSEATARASADGALSTRIDNLVVESGNSTAAAIDAEATARANADTALAAQITTVSARASAQRVFYQASPPGSTDRIVGDLWFDSDDGNKPYFWDGDSWNDNSDARFAAIAASVTTETVARTNADSALSAQITSLISTVNGNTAAISNEAVTRADADTALSGQISSLTSTVNGNTAAIQSEATTRANADTALSNQISSLTSTVNGNTAAIQSEATTRANADTALSGQISSLTSTVNGNTAAITNEATTRANADTALSNQITTVSAQAGAQRVFRQPDPPSATGRIVGDLWYDSDDSFKPYYWNGSAWADNSDGRFATLQSSITSEATARANADTALANQITTVSAQASAQRVFNQTSAPSSTGRIVGDLWYDSGNGFKPYYWNGTAWVDNSDNRFTTIAASVTNETTARVSADNALSSQISSLTSTVNGNTAAINSEAATRANADSALSGQITSLTTTVNNNKASFDQEVIARTNADSALSSQITTVSATASQQRVFRQSTAPASTGRIVGDVWYDTGNGNKPFVWDGSTWVETTDVRITNNTAAISTETTARANADSALAGQITSLTTTVNNNKAAFDQEVINRTNADSALSTQITTVSATASKQRVFRQSTAPAATGLIVGDLWFDTANGNKPYAWDGSTWIETSDARISQNAAAITTEATTRANADSALSNQITTVSAQASAQRVFRQSTAPTSTGRIVGDIWFDTANGNKTYIWSGSAWTETTDVRITDNAAAITNEATARANADSAIANNVTNLTATVNAQGTNISQNTAAIQSEATTRANADSGLAGQINTVSAVASKQRTFVQGTAPGSTGLIVGDLWLDSANGLKPYYWSGSAWTDATDTRITANAAAISNEATARANADNSLASQISTVSATVDGNTASISSQSTAIANINGTLGASWSVQGNVDGTTGGLRLTGLKKSDGSGAVYNLIIDANTTINGNLVVNGTIGNAQLAPGAVSRVAFAHNYINGAYQKGPSSVTFPVRPGASILLSSIYYGSRGRSAFCTVDKKSNVDAAFSNIFEDDTQLWTGLPTDLSGSTRLPQRNFTFVYTAQANETEITFRVAAWIYVTISSVVNNAGKLRLVVNNTVGMANGDYGFLWQAGTFLLQFAQFNIVGTTTTLDFPNVNYSASYATATELWVYTGPTAISAWELSR